MAPPFHRFFVREDGGDEGPLTPDSFASQWANPTDILSVLLLLGPHIVHHCIAALAGRVVTPVAFSFGWVTYAISSLTRIFGDGRLMPDVDVANTTVIGTNSGHSRTTTSWVLGRLLRDANDRVDREMRNEQPHQSSAVSPTATNQSSAASKTTPSPVPNPKASPAWEALRVTVYRFNDEPPQPHGVPTLDLLWWSGFVIIVLELVISIIPWIIDGDWGPFLLTSSGNVLAIASSSLPQWREEKWSCPKNGGDTVAITEGNGSRHALLILGKRGVGLDLEILARSTRTSRPSLFTELTSVSLAILWICHLIVVAGMGRNTWYILAIGVLGGAQNLYVAASPRTPAAMGLHLTHVETIRGKKVAGVLRQVEEKYPKSGTSLIDTFFPGGFRVPDQGDLEFWRSSLRARYAPTKHGPLVETREFGPNVNVA